jgi:hypothetical protein
VYSAAYLAKAAKKSQLAKVVRQLQLIDLPKPVRDDPT